MGDRNKILKLIGYSLTDIAKKDYKSAKKELNRCIDEIDSMIIE